MTAHRSMASSSIAVRPFPALLLILALAAVRERACSAPAIPADLDAYVRRAMETFEVPGLSLAIVKDDEVLVATGYGVRRVADAAAVDARTLFAIASNTKVFTAAALGLLVEEGKLEWDAPVIRHLPWFQMWDPYVTRELTIRDLLVHRSGLGLGAGDLLWWPPSTYDRKDVARRLRSLRPAFSFRSAYAYDNVLYLVAGEVIEAVSGRTWEQFVAERILERVGMSSSRVRHPDPDGGQADPDGRHRDPDGGGNIAATHAQIDGAVRGIAPFVSDNTNPAGGILSCALDMAAWMRVLLSGGLLADGSRLYSAATAGQLTTLVTPMPIADPPPELAALKPNFRGYALGLVVQDYRGRKVVTHTGGLPGQVSRVTLVPEIGLGICVLTNQEATEAFNAITWRIVDGFLGAPAADWIEAYRKVRRRAEDRASRTREMAAASRDASSRPSLAPGKYAGTYVDDWYGDIEIEDVDGRLRMRFSRTPLLVGDLEHWQYDTFIVRWLDRELRADAYVTFVLDAEGRVDEARMRAVSPETDFSFDFHDLRLRPALRTSGSRLRRP